MIVKFKLDLCANNGVNISGRNVPKSVMEKVPVNIPAA